MLKCCNSRPLVYNPKGRGSNPEWRDSLNERRNLILISTFIDERPEVTDKKVDEGILEMVILSQKVN